LYPPFSAQMIGADIESLLEDYIVFIACRHMMRATPPSPA